MRYEHYKGHVKLSKLGFGAMRLPQTAPGFAGPIDEPQARAIIDRCMAQGVNYYDTAYIYHGGNSEVVLGRALSQYPRVSFHIADKFNVQQTPIIRRSSQNSWPACRWNTSISTCCTG